MTLKEEGSPEIQVHVNILQVEPTAGQLSAWRRLWDRLLSASGPDSPHDAEVAGDEELSPRGADDGG